MHGYERETNSFNFINYLIIPDEKEIHSNYFRSYHFTGFTSVLWHQIHSSDNLKINNTRTSLQLIGLKFSSIYFD